jgi:hypothetical protein
VPSASAGIAGDAPAPAAPSALARSPELGIIGDGDDAGPSLAEDPIPPGATLGAAVIGAPDGAGFPNRGASKPPPMPTSFAPALLALPSLNFELELSEQPAALANSNTHSILVQARIALSSRALAPNLAVASAATGCNPRASA